MSSAISYLDETWNPIVGCTPKSEGCQNCWAQAMADRFGGVAHGPKWVGGHVYDKQRVYPRACARVIVTI